MLAAAPCVARRMPKGLVPANPTGKQRLVRHSRATHRAWSYSDGDIPDGKSASNLPNARTTGKVLAKRELLAKPINSTVSLIRIFVKIVVNPINAS